MLLEPVQGQGLLAVLTAATLHTPRVRWLPDTFMLVLSFGSLLIRYPEQIMYLIDFVFKKLFTS